MNPSLHDLGVSLGTDKATHGYLPVYERYLERFLPQSVLLLEIGVWGGASLNMWRAYFRPSSRIVGIDNNPACATSCGMKAVNVYIGRQEDLEFLDRVIKEIGQPDIIVDDGSHRVQHQTASFRRLFPQLAPGGVYFVEDVHWGWGPGDHDPRGGFGEFAKTLLDHVNLHSKRTGDWSGDKRRQVSADVVLSEWEKTVKSIAFFKSLIVFEKEVCPL